MAGLGDPPLADLLLGLKGVSSGVAALRDGSLLFEVFRSP